MYFYILYSANINRYYKGVSEDPERRLIEHNSAIKAAAYTVIANDWELIFKLNCENKSQALKIERYFKKSANIEYLKRFISNGDLQIKILERFKV